MDFGKLLIGLVSSPRRARVVAAHGPSALVTNNAALVFRWSDVCSVLEDSASFSIEPINADRIENVSGPFLLGMDCEPRSIAQRSIAYPALATVGQSAIEARIASEIGRLLPEGPRDIDCIVDFARPAAASVAQRVFGVSGPDPKEYMTTIRRVFHETFLNPGNDEKVRIEGRAAGKRLLEWIKMEIALRRQNGPTSGGSDMLSGLMALQTRPTNPSTDDEIACILAGFLVGSIDTTTTCVANIVSEALDDEALMRAMYKDLASPRRLLGWCMEVLRRRPHNPILLRVAREGAKVAGKPIPPGTTVICVLTTAMQDGAAWPEPERLDPTRPLDRYLHFGRGLHHCGGRDINVIQIPSLVGALLRRRPVRISPLAFDGPFPDSLKVHLSH